MISIAYLFIFALASEQSIVISKDSVSIDAGIVCEGGDNKVIVFIRNTTSEALAIPLGLAPIFPGSHTWIELVFPIKSGKEVVSYIRSPGHLVLPLALEVPSQLGVGKVFPLEQVFGDNLKAMGFPVRVKWRFLIRGQKEGVHVIHAGNFYIPGLRCE